MGTKSNLLPKGFKIKDPNNWFESLPYFIDSKGIIQVFPSLNLTPELEN